MRIMNSKILFHTVFLSAFISFGGSSIQAGDWPGWRGPTGDGIAAAGDYPADLAPAKALAWKVPLPGPGCGTPAVLGNQVFVVSEVQGKDGLLCFGLEDGQELWRKVFGAARKPRHKAASSANPSPVCDGERVVVYYKSGRLACLDLEGKVLWQDNLQERFGEDTLWWDLGTSPVLTRKHVIVQVAQEGTSFVVAFDKVSGQLAWKVDRTFDTPKESGQAYTTPIVLEREGQEQLLIWAADHLTLHNATDGKCLWTQDGFNPQNREMWRVIASAAVADDFAVLPFGRGRHVAGVRLPGHPDGKPGTVWHTEGVGSDVPTPIIQGDGIYVLSDKGELCCLRLKDGAIRWEEKMPRSGGKFYASPTLVGKRLYIVSEKGEVSIGSISADGYTKESFHKLGETVIATPVLVNGRILFRGWKNLYCFE